MQALQTSGDSHAELRALYRSLLDREDRYQEFKQLLALYPTNTPEVGEQAEAVAIREQLNERIRDWLGGNFGGLNTMQIQLWRTIIVEERFNVALSPWKEANMY